MEKRHYYSVDIVKTVCAVFIIFIHTEPLSSVNGQLNSLLVNCVCRIAVPFFFISSGFFLFSKCGVKNPDMTAVKGYVKRILFLYLIWSAVYFPFTALKILYPENGETAFSVFAGWLKNMIFSAGYGFLWYLPATVVAAALTAAFLKSGMGINKIIFIALALYCVGLCGQSYYGLVRLIPFPEGFLNAVKSVYDIFGTTRNGIFEGFIFIVLGARLSESENAGRFKNNMLLFAAFMLLLTAEFVFVGKMKWHLEYDMYLFLIPAAYFLFRSAISFDKPLASKHLRLLRPYSSLFYFVHMLPIELYCIFTKRPYTNSVLMFFIAFIPTVIISTLIIFVSEKKHFGFLKKIC